VPGFTADEIELRVEPGRLMLIAKHEKKLKEEKENIVYSEFHKDEILRSIDLPVKIDPDEAKAVLHNGIVKVTLAKAAAGKKVPVSAVAA
jgi:HSP20 family molecular chaperone IbpA